MHDKNVLANLHCQVTKWTTYRYALPESPTKLSHQNTDFKLYPSHIHVMYILEISDVEQIPYCRWLTHFIRGYTDIFRYSLLIKHSFTLVDINDPKSRTWRATNSHTFHERLLHYLESQRNIVWCLWMVNNWSHFPQKWYQQNFTIMNFTFLLEGDERY